MSKTKAPQVFGLSQAEIETAADDIASDAKCEYGNSYLGYAADRGWIRGAVEKALRDALRLQHERIAEALRSLHDPKRCRSTCDCETSLIDRLERGA